MVDIFKESFLFLIILFFVLFCGRNVSFLNTDGKLLFLFVNQSVNVFYVFAQK